MATQEDYLKSLFARAVQQAELSRSPLCVSPDVAEYAAPISAIFLASDGQIYGFCDTNVLYYDESEGVDTLGGCWHHGYMHKFTGHVTCEMVAGELLLTVEHIIKTVA